VTELFARKEKDNLLPLTVQLDHQLHPHTPIAMSPSLNSPSIPAAPTPSPQPTHLSMTIKAGDGTGYIAPEFEGKQTQMLAGLLRCSKRLRGVLLMKLSDEPVDGQWFHSRRVCRVGDNVVLQLVGNR
jgi:hypothetical protein